VVATEDEVTVIEAIEGFDTVVTVKMFPLSGKTPDGATAFPDTSVAETAEADSRAKETVFPAERPVAGSIASITVLVCPAGTDQFKPGKSRTPLFKELYWATTLPFSIRYADEMELSDKTPCFLNFKPFTVTAPDTPAVSDIPSISTRAADVVPEMSDPAEGLLAAIATFNPVAGAGTDGPEGTDGPPVTGPIIDATADRVMGPKYPAAGEIPFAAWNLANAARVNEPK